MPNYNTATVDDSTFQQDDRIGKGWRKRYARENDGEWENTGEGWDWSGSVKTAASKPKLVVEVEEPVVEEEEEVEEVEEEEEPEEAEEGEEE